MVGKLIMFGNYLFVIQKILLILQGRGLHSYDAHFEEVISHAILFVSNYSDLVGITWNISDNRSNFALKSCTIKFNFNANQSRLKNEASG